MTRVYSDRETVLTHKLGTDFRISPCQELLSRDGADFNRAKH